MAVTAAESGLKPGAVGLPEVLFQAITDMAPGVGAAFAIIIGASFAGAALPLAVALATLGCFLTAISLSQLVKHMPTAGSFYTYTSQALHPSVGFLLGWLYALGYAAGFPLCIVLLGVIVPAVFGPASLWWLWVVLGSVIVVTLAYFGVRIATRVGLALGVIEIAIFLALAVTLIAKAGSQNTLAVFSLSSANVSGYAGLSGIFAGLIYAIFAYIGFENAAPLAEETRNPRRNIALAALGSSLGIGIYYVIVTYGGAVFFGPSKMAGFAAYNGGNPYQALANAVWGGAGILVAFALINSSIACSNAINLATTRVWYAMGRIRLLPGVFAHVHPKHRTPDVAIIVAFLVNLVAALGLGFKYGPFTAFAILGTILTLVAVLNYIVLNVSSFAYYIRFQRSEFNIVTHGIIPLLGVGLFVPVFLTAAGITVFSFVSPLPAPLSYAGAVIGVWFVIGVIYMIYLYRVDPSRIAATKTVFTEEAGVEGSVRAAPAPGT
jgi:amino acid transporter